MPGQNSHLRTAVGALRVPETQNLGSVKLWVEYAIWGLLFYDDQSPWITVVECLHICFHRKRANLPIFTGLKGTAQNPEHELVHYGLQLNNTLRHLLFRDKDLLRIADRKSDDDKGTWRVWFETVARRYEGLEIGYLEQSFDNFRDFARAIELLRTAEIESHTDKRWTSRHLLPLGPSMLFPDVNEENKLDRKFMRRTGEMLYLMLNRSDKRAAVEQLLEERLLSADGVWNRLAKRLGGQESQSVNDAHIGYLPMPTYQIYDRIAEDWIAILSLRNIPIENALDPLERISGLLQALYILVRANEVIGPDAPPLSPFFLDIVGAAGNNPVRKLSANQYRNHRTLPLDATDGFLDAFVASAEWKAVQASAAGAKEASALLAKRFLWSPRRTPDPDRLPDADAQVAEMYAEAQATKGHHIGAAFTNHVKQIGLLRAQRSSGTWYAPNDAFLEALVLANVTTPIEFGEFLNRLMTRYNIVIGPVEVRHAFDVTTGALPAPEADLKENERRLEERLRILGFLERKSDDCAFVINPFIETDQAAFGEPERVNA